MTQHDSSDRPRLSIATVATDTPMGAQAYQEQVASRAVSALELVDDRIWRVRRRVVRSMRSPLPGDLRLPLAWTSTASPAARAAVGRMLYGRPGIVHRMALELPPAPVDVVTLHDVVAWRFGDESAPVRAAAAELRRAAAVVCVSEFSANEAETLLGITSPHVISNGVDDRFFDATPLSEDQRRRLGVPTNYVLHAGGASRRKNLEALAEAWPRVHRAQPRLSLVLAGPPHPRRTSLFDGMPGVVLTGRLPDPAMPGLVAGARVVVVPSLYEGFGLPALEAMAARVPLVAAATSSLPEVVADAGLLVAPTAEAIAEAILEAAGDDTAIADMVERGRQRAAEFTWERSAQAHARLWSSIA